MFCVFCRTLKLILKGRTGKKTKNRKNKHLDVQNSQIGKITWGAEQKHTNSERRKITVFFTPSKCNRNLLYKPRILLQNHLHYSSHSRLQINTFAL